MGVFLTITALIITTKWENSIYFPYSFPSLFYYNNAEKLNIATWHGFNITEPISIGLFIVVLFIGARLFKTKQLR